MNIIESVEVPKRIIQLANRLNKECKNPVNTIAFTFGGPTIPDRGLGGYFPALNTIFIYMDKCMTSQYWVERGVSLISAIWLNLLTAVVHEFVHVWQVEDEPKLVKAMHLPEDYEIEAWQVAVDIVDDFAEYLQPPKLEDMGWVGQEIVAMLNHLFVSHPSKVQELLEFNGSGLGGDAVAIAVMSGKYEDDTAIGRLLQHIDEGFVGKKMGNKRYLTFQETVGLFNSNSVEG